MALLHAVVKIVHSQFCASAGMGAKTQRQHSDSGTVTGAVLVNHLVVRVRVR